VYLFVAIFPYVGSVRVRSFQKDLQWFPNVVGMIDIMLVLEGKWFGTVFSVGGGSQL